MQIALQANFETQELSRIGGNTEAVHSQRCEMA